jgi:uncharacterized protein YkwD
LAQDKAAGSLASTASLRPNCAIQLKQACSTVDTGGVSKLRALPAITIAILACACTGAMLDTAAAAQSRNGTGPAGIHAAAPTASSAAREAPRQRRSHDTCRTLHRRTKDRSTCSSHAVRPLGRFRLAHRQLHATLASVLGTPCANAELTPTPDDLAAIQTATLCLVNQERARNDELPLLPNWRLTQAAQGHGEEMINQDYFAHVSPSGLTPVSRIESTGYVPNRQVGYTLGENLAWGTLQLSTPSAIVAAWIASPEHLANILFSHYRDTAIAVVPAVPASLAEGQPGALYTQEFGVIVR